jgi:hypothetical protein
MKTFTKLFIVLLFAFGVKSNAQITNLHTYPGIIDGSNLLNFQAVYLAHSGFKFVLLHADTLTFYNLNLSLYRNAVFPNNWTSGSNYYICFISEGLLDLDTNHIDFLVGTYDSSAIYKDDGTFLFGAQAGVSFTGPGMGSPIFSSIVPTDSGTYMLLSSFVVSGTILYKLPGSLPCIPGCGNFASALPVINHSSNGYMSVYPNPTTNYSNIYYSLPPGANEGEITVYDLAGREVKKYTVTRQFDHLQLTTSDIKAGTYFYQLTVNGNNISTKKIVVVK